MAQGSCKYCHKLVNPKTHTFKLFRTRTELCGNCHKEILQGKNLHKPLEQGQCTECHNPHSSDNKALVRFANIEEACRKCHKKKEDVKNPHEPAAKGKCTACHSSHSSPYRPLLINSQRQLCFSCHEKTKWELDEYKYVHKPATDRGCRVCHEPHGSDYYRLLVKEYTPEFYAPFDIANYALCFTCHQANLVLNKETDNATDFRNGKVNLHYLHVNTQERGRTCRTCHATHASNEPRHLRKVVPYGDWEIPIQFNKTETGGGCSPGCHNPRTYDRVEAVVYKSDGAH